MSCELMSTFGYLLGYSATVVIVLNIQARSAKRSGGHNQHAAKGGRR